MTENLHPLTRDRAAELWDASRDPRRPLADRHEELHHDERTTAVAALRAAFDAGRKYEREHDDPYHDPRYVPCGPEFHYQEPGGRRGIWDRQTGEVAWFSSPKDSPAFLTRLAERIDVGLDSRGEWAWSPAPTPPTEEVELPTEFGAVITDVEADFGETYRFDRMVWTGWRWTYRDHSTTAEFITAFTLPDGTRARRDGEHPDGRPRFVKETHNDRP